MKWFTEPRHLLLPPTICIHCSLTFFLKYSSFQIINNLIFFKDRRWMIHCELLEIARLGKIGSELSFHFIIIQDGSGEDTGHWISLSSILENCNRNVNIGMNRDRSGCGGSRNRRAVGAECSDGSLISRSWRSQHSYVHLTKRLKSVRATIRVGR